MSYNQPNDHEKKVRFWTRTFNHSAIVTGLTSLAAIYMVANMDNGRSFDMDSKVDWIVAERVKQDPKLDQVKFKAYVSDAADKAEIQLRLACGFFPLMGVGMMLLNNRMLNRTLAKGPE